LVDERNNLVTIIFGPDLVFYHIDRDAVYFFNNITKSHSRKNTRKTNTRKKRIGMNSGLLGKEDNANLKRRAQDRNQWRNWIIKNEGQEPAD